jgi:hypothetical protein
VRRRSGRRKRVERTRFMATASLVSVKGARSSREIFAKDG